MEEFVRKHYALFVKLVEGETPIDDWRKWIDQNALEIHSLFGRTNFMKLKIRSVEEAAILLRQFNIPFRERNDLDDLCRRCGAKVFRAIPGKTTKREIVEFARTAKFPESDQVAKDAWIHPGVHCPNGCTSLLVSYKR